MGSSILGCLLEVWFSLSVGLVPLPPKITPYSVGPTRLSKTSFKISNRLTYLQCRVVYADSTGGLMPSRSYMGLQSRSHKLLSNVRCLFVAGSSLWCLDWRFGGQAWGPLDSGRSNLGNGHGCLWSSLWGRSIRWIACCSSCSNACSCRRNSCDRWFGWLVFID